MPNKPSLRDVAKQANVSLGTVSNVLNRPTSVSEETRLKVREAIDMLGFTPNINSQLNKYFEDAVNAHLLPSGYQPIFSQSGQVSVSAAIEPWWVPSSTHAWDPFMSNMTGYATSTCGIASTEMYDRFMNFQQIGGVWRSAIEVAAFTARCGNNVYSNPTAACFDFGGMYNVAYEIDILNNYSKQKGYLLTNLLSK